MPKSSALVVGPDTSPRYWAMEHPNPAPSPEAPLRVFPAGAAVAVLTAEGLDRLLDYRAPAGGVRAGVIRSAAAPVSRSSGRAAGGAPRPGARVASRSMTDSGVSV